MKSDIVTIDNQGNGFEDAIRQTEQLAKSLGLDHESAVRLQLMTEEILSLVRSVTGELSASFWIEGEGTHFVSHLTTKTVMDKAKRYQLISSSTSRKNEAAKGLRGRLRDALETALAAEPDHADMDYPIELGSDLPVSHMDDPEWDGYERSILRRLADDIKVSIRRGRVELTVSADLSR